MSKLYMVWITVLKIFSFLCSMLTKFLTCTMVITCAWPLRYRFSPALWHCNWRMRQVVGSEQHHTHHWLSDYTSLSYDVIAFLLDETFTRYGLMFLLGSRNRILKWSGASVLHCTYNLAPVITKVPYNMCSCDSL